MKIDELKAFIEKHTTDGEVNYDGLNRDINTSFDAVIERKEAAARDGVDINAYKAAGAAELLKKYDFPNEDAFSAYVANAKQGETELSQKATRLEGEKANLESKIKELEGSVGTLSQGKTQLERLHYALTNKDAVVNPDFAEFVVDKVGRSLGEGDDFKEVFKKYLADNPQFGTTEGRPNIGQPTGGRSGGEINPFAKETRDLAAQTRLFRENPAKARELAKQAGVKI